MTYDPNSGASVPTTTYGSEPGRTEQVASSAKEQGRQTAAVAGEELRSVASEASTQARNLAGELRTQVGQQTVAQKGKLTQALTTFTDELQQMASAGGGSGIATELVRQLATRAQSLTSQIDQAEPEDLLHQTRSLARKRPAAFLGGALVAGILAGRITRGAKTAVGSESDSYPQQARFGTTPTLPAPQPTAAMTSTYGEPTFEPSTYETGYTTVEPGYTTAEPGYTTDPGYSTDPDAPVTRPYGGGGVA